MGGGNLRMERLNPNFWHPYARYGVAVAVVEQNAFNHDLSDSIVLEKLAKHSLQEALDGYLIRTFDNPSLQNEEIKYSYVSKEDTSEAFKKDGVMLSPHVLTSNDRYGGKWKGCFDKVQKDLIKNPEKPSKKENLQELFQSFAPMVKEINKEGNEGSSNPKVTYLEAAFTAITTLTKLKPCLNARIPNKGTDKKQVWANHGIIPDLPIWEELDKKSTPLIDFVLLFKNISETYQGDILKAKVRVSKKYPQPLIFRGNFPNANRLSNGSLGVVSLVAAIGRWTREIQYFRDKSSINWADRVLHFIQKNPLYIVSNEGSFQESFNHHLIDLTLKEDLTAIGLSFYRVRLLFGNDDERKKQTFLMMAERFLRLYTPESFKVFLSFRAEYPAELSKLLNHYFMTTKQNRIDLEIVKSARAYGESLNLAAYIAAKEDCEKDASKSLNDYKDRVLTQLESTIGSTKSSTALFQQLGSIAGRLVKRDISSASGRFMEAVFTGEIDVEDAKNMITAFMRLSTYTEKPTDNN